MAHEPELIPNFTLFIQLGIFLLCYLTMKHWVFGPFLELLQAREAKTTGLREQAILDREQGEKMRVDYEAFMKEERKKLTTWVDGERKKIADEERAIIQQARMAVGEKLQALRSSLQEEVEAARESLLPQIGEYSSNIASQVVGQPIKVSSSSVTSKMKGEHESQVVRD